MTNKIFILIVLIIYNSCINENIAQTNKNTNPESNKEINLLGDTVSVKQWLIKVIIDYVNSEDSKSADENLQKVLTTDYYRYKIDAITLESSDMTNEEFNNKWKSKYDTRYAGHGGFFTSVMDHGNVEISKCRPIKTYGDTAKIFHTIVHDIRWNTDYTFEIKIIYKDNRLLIDDVKEQKYGR